MSYFNKRSLDRFYWPLKSADVVSDGTVVALNGATGKVEVATTGAVIPVGFATVGAGNGTTASNTPTFTGDGTAALCVQLFQPINVYGLLNDSGTALTHPGQVAYLLDGTHVTGSVTGRAAGVVYDIDSAGLVWVHFDDAAGAALALSLALALAAD